MPEKFEVPDSNRAITIPDGGSIQEKPEGGYVVSFTRSNGQEKQIHYNADGTSDLASNYSGTFSALAEADRQNGGNYSGVNTPAGQLLQEARTDVATHLSVLQILERLGYKGQELTEDKLNLAATLLADQIAETIDPTTLSDLEAAFTTSAALQEAGWDGDHETSTEVIARAKHILERTRIEGNENNSNTDEHDPTKW